VPLSGVIFDFDGVLADSEPLHLRAFQQVLAPRQVALETTDYYEQYLGFDDEGVFRAIARAGGWELTEATLADLITRKGECFDALVQRGAALFPGAADAVRRIAREVPIAVASGAMRSEIETLLSTTDLRRHFQVVVASGDTPRSKPAPDPYARAVYLLRESTKAAQLDPQGCFVAVEDSNWGIESALAAGLRCIGIAHTYPADTLRGAHTVLPSIGHLDIKAARQVCRNA
jgi:beta-phosphoglucomutase